MDALYGRELETTLQESNVHSFHLKINLFPFFSIMFDVGLLDMPKAFRWSLTNLILRSLVGLQLKIIIIAGE